MRAGEGAFVSSVKLPSDGIFAYLVSDVSFLCRMSIGRVWSIYVGGHIEMYVGYAC